jgi:hypothetical protein
MSANSATSSLTTVIHLAVLAEAPVNTWGIRRGLDYVKWALVEELDDLIVGRLDIRRGRKRTVSHGDLVILVAQDHIVAAEVRQPHLLHVPIWLLVSGCFVAPSLYSAATSVTFLRLAAPQPGVPPRR